MYQSNIHYIFSSEFDNKLGPVVKYQYPKKIPGFTDSSSHLGKLASLMLPTNIELKSGEDYTVFFLYKNKRQTYQLFPPVDEDTRGIILEEEESQSNETLFCLNVVMSKPDPTNSRGATIKSVAIATPISSFMMYKPFLLMLLNQYMNDSSLRVLTDFFTLINSVDLGPALRCIENPSVQRILGSMDDELADIVIERALPRLLKVKELPHEDFYGNQIIYKGSVMEYRLKRTESSISHIPLQVNLISQTTVRSETNYNKHVLKFLQKFIINYSQLNILGNKCWKLIVHSSAATNEELCKFICALSRLLGGSVTGSTYFRDPIQFIPFLDVSYLDALKEFVLNQPDMFLFIGVTNAIFKAHSDTWDFYYDMDSGKLDTRHSRSSFNLPDLQTPQLFKFRSQNSVARSQSSASSISDKSALATGPQNQKSMLPDCIAMLVEGQHDNQTILNVFKRCNIIQILQLDNSSELQLKDSYMMKYKDVVVFNDFFQFQCLQLFRYLSDLEAAGGEFESLYRIYTGLYKFAGASRGNIEILLFILLNYPYKDQQLIGGPAQAKFKLFKKKKETTVDLFTAPKAMKLVMMGLFYKQPTYEQDMQLKKVVVRLLHKIEQHPIGSVILAQSNRMGFLSYAHWKGELFDQEKTQASPTRHEILEGLNIPPPPVSMTDLPNTRPNILSAVSLGGGGGGAGGEDFDFHKSQFIDG